MTERTTGRRSHGDTPCSQEVVRSSSNGWPFNVRGPNSVALATEKITVQQLVRAGLPLNLLGIVLVTAATFTLVPLVFP